jgi:hypothetical protein
VEEKGVALARCLSAERFSVRWGDQVAMAALTITHLFKLCLRRKQNPARHSKGEEGARVYLHKGSKEAGKKESEGSGLGRGAGTREKQKNQKDKQTSRDKRKNKQ